MTNEEPVPTEPARQGLPDHADDDSFAEPSADLGRAADGPAPAAVPAEREDPVPGIENTRDEGSEESLDDRVRQEEPDVDPSRAAEEMDRSSGDAADPGLEADGAEREFGDRSVG